MENNEAIEKSVDLIIQELDEVNEKVFKQLTEKAPETTQRIRIFLGRKDYIRNGIKFGSDLEYRDFLKAILISYLENKGIETGSDFMLKYIEDIDWDSSEELSGGISGGVYYGGDYMFTSIVPFSEVKNIEETLDKSLEGSELRTAIKKFLRSYLELMDETYHKSNYRTLKNIVSHELTHYFIRNNTEIGDLREHAKSDELLDQVDMERLVMGSKSDSKSIVNVKRQAERISNNTVLTTIEEIFCFFIGNCYTEKNLARNPEDFSHSYENPEEIAWGVRILEEKTRELERSKVDWSRRKAVQTMENIAQKGQIRKSGGSTRPEAIFLQTMLPSDEKHRLEKFKEICEGELSTAFSDLRRIIEKTEKSSETSSVETHELEKLQSEIDWENPAHIEEVVLHKTSIKAVEETKSLEETVKLFNRNIEKEVERLKKYIIEVSKVSEDLQSGSESQKIEEAIAEMKKSAEDMDQLTY